MRGDAGRSQPPATLPTGIRLAYDYPSSGLVLICPGAPGATRLLPLFPAQDNVGEIGSMSAKRCNWPNG